jgi:hypothetical protein
MRDCSGTQQRWRERIERQRSSGLSVIEFCRREGINKAGFYCWKRRVSDVSDQGLDAAKAAAAEIESGAARVGSERFVVGASGEGFVELKVARADRSEACVLSATKMASTALSADRSEPGEAAAAAPARSDAHSTGAHPRAGRGAAMVASPVSAIEVHLANGRILVVPAGFDAGHLTRLIAVVEAMA